MTETSQTNEIGVDAGMIMIIDPCYILRDNKTDMDFGYNELCKNLEKSKQPNIMEYKGGLIVSSGFGDGSYKVETVTECGRVREVHIKFFEKGDAEEISRMFR